LELVSLTVPLFSFLTAGLFFRNGTFSPVDAVCLEGFFFFFGLFCLRASWRAAFFSCLCESLRCRGFGAETVVPPFFSPIFNFFPFFFGLPADGPFLIVPHISHPHGFAGCGKPRPFFFVTVPSGIWRVPFSTSFGDGSFGLPDCSQSLFPFVAGIVLKCLTFLKSSMIRAFFSDGKDSVFGRV